MTPCNHDRFPLPSGFARHGAAALAAGLLVLLQACGAKQEVPPAAEPLPTPYTETQPAPVPEVPSLNGRFLADAQEYPWSAIGRVNLAGRGFCNGIMISDRQVLTQAQCLYTRREGRWWQPGELHFIAAYQRDRFLADSKITRFVAAPGYNPAAGASLSNLTNNWAILELAQPIGLKTGWLGLQRNEDGLKAAETGGSAVFLRAGYRSDWPNAISVFIGCRGPALGAADLCAATPNERALPPFVITDGEMRVVSDHFVRSAEVENTLASVAAISRSGSRLGGSRLPQANNPIRREASVTASLLLQALGYPEAAQSLQAATAQYLKNQNLTADTKSDVGLLAALIATAQNAPSR